MQSSTFGLAADICLQCGAGLGRAGQPSGCSAWLAGGGSRRLGRRTLRLGLGGRSLALLPQPLAAGAAAAQAVAMSMPVAVGVAVVGVPRRAAPPARRVLQVVQQQHGKEAADKHQAGNALGQARAVVVRCAVVVVMLVVMFRLHLDMVVAVVRGLQRATSEECRQDGQASMAGPVHVSSIRANCAPTGSLPPPACRLARNPAPHLCKGVEAFRDDDCQG